MYSTYISFKEVNSLSSTLNTIIDSRGSFTELIKSKSFGQLSLNITSPGIEKGNHYHNHKHEKFTVVSGSGEIKMRKLFDNQIIIIKVSDRKIQSIDIPPGYVHSIRNTGSTDLITIIWANEEFDQKYPDTYQTEV
jgi:UDP-2-acetamido-2,6-beta-L-arabino-hexul-4-ose reductase